MHKFDDIIPPSRRKEAVPLSAHTDSRISSAHKPRFPYVTLIAVVVIVAGSIGALVYFSSAKIDIVPNAVSAAVQESFVAGQEAGNVPFKVITAQKIASQSLKGTGTKNVTSHASGMITVYNTQSTSQPLVTRTRFATNTGLVYRIQTSITVPGGSEASPGTVVAKVVADQPGGSYNVGPSSFTVPGLAGTPQASQVYARSTSSMVGGASGAIPTVDAADEVGVRAELTTALSSDLKNALDDQVPEGYILLPGAATTTYQALDSTPSSTAGQVDVKQQGTVTAIVFPNAALAKAIALSVPGLNYQGEPLTLSSIDTLTLTLADAVPADEMSTFSFSLAGTAPLTYTVDTNRIAAAVAGKARSAAEVALTNYPEVSRATIVLRPFWKKAFPEDPASIEVTVVAPE